MNPSLNNNARFVTMHIQKDGRTSIGTAIHKFADCPSLKSRTGVIAVGPSETLIQHLPKCSYCYERVQRNL